VIGGQPILILREGTQRTKGKEAQSMNFTASRAVAEAVRTTLGPKGMDKMLVDSMGDVVITNDGATILKEMDIEHPAAKMMVEVAKTQDDEVGDGTTTAVVLAGELLKNAEELLEQDVHPTVIEKGYSLAAEKAIEVAESLSRTISIKDEDLLKKIAETALTGKGTDVGKDIIPGLVVEAVKSVVQKVDKKFTVDEDDIKIEKKVSGSVSDSELVEGVVVDKERAAEGMPRKVCDAQILVYDQPLELTKTKTDAKIKIKDPTQMKLFMERDHEALIDKAEKIIASGANVVFCQKGIDDLVQWHFSRNGIMAVENVKREDIETISKVTGARVVSSLDDLSAADLGQAGEVEETTDIESGCETCGID
jgi:chaperonin GroEL (HSP60 family)